MSVCRFPTFHPLCLTLSCACPSETRSVAVLSFFGSNGSRNRREGRCQGALISIKTSPAPSPPVPSGPLHHHHNIITYPGTFVPIIARLILSVWVILHPKRTPANPPYTALWRLLSLYHCPIDCQPSLVLDALVPLRSTTPSPCA